jgi:hypothetical protein
VELVDPAGHACPALHSPKQALAEVAPTALLKRPLGQSWHPATPPVLYLPAPHTRARAVVDPGGHSWPASHSPEQSAVVSPGVPPHLPIPHSTHAAALPAPAPALYRPPGQSSHADDPWVLNCPAPHTAILARTEPGGQNHPAAHSPLHSLDDSPTSAPNRPGGHTLHSTAPDKLYFPVGHTAGSPPSFPQKDPARHSSHSSDPTTLNRPTGQGEGLVAPTPHAELAGHAVHAVALPVLYLPAVHAAGETVPTTGHSDPGGHG